MSHRPPTDPDDDALRPAAAERVLARASRLDAARADAVRVRHLRAAAVEAGIGPGAFDTALAEVRTEDAPRPSAGAAAGRRARRWFAGAAATVALVAAALATAGLRTGANAPPGVSTVEEGVLLRCLAPGEAAELVRPLLSDRASTVRFNPRLAPRVLTIRTTPERLARAKTLLAEQEGAGARSCTAAPPAR